ncbi:MAG: hypothetical protein DBY18_01790 [Clostridia bacterium]|nr:MAG: hypothetical protein DBY18_01790 [Clostridia bacterium]
MEKINYQRETDRIIATLTEKGQRERLLLHACCGPCASYVLEYLSAYFDITVFFCNPNITDRAEYEKRLATLRQLCAAAPFCRGVEIVDDTLTAEDFFAAAKGLEAEPEGGARCTKCFLQRIERTAAFAKENGFDRFATTLTVSPHKDAALINRIGLAAAEKSGVAYLPSDFKKRGGYQRSIVLSREYDLYRQHFCGCVYSMA